MIRGRQQELICTECPLSSCDEDSIWCVWRMMTDPNNAQKSLIKKKDTLKRSKYWAEWYQKNRPARLAAANLRNKRKREHLG